MNTTATATQQKTQRRDAPIELTKDKFLASAPFWVKGTICTGAVKLVKAAGAGSDWLHVSNTNAPLCIIDQIHNHGFSFSINVLGNPVTGFTLFKDCVLVKQ